MSKRRGNNGDAWAELGAAQALPHSEESERAVLAAVLLDPRVLPTVAGRLHADDFYLERHQHLFRAMQDLADEGSPVDVRTIQARLELRDQWTAAGGAAYLARLDVDLPDLGRVEAYADIVKDRAVRRRLIQLAGESARGALQGDTPTLELVGRQQSGLVELAGGAIARRAQPIAAAVHRLVEQMEDGTGAAVLRGAPSGFPAVDAHTNGLVGGNLIVVGGRTSMGKTIYGFQLALNTALERKRPAGVISLEMTLDELAVRAVANLAEVALDQIRDGNLSRGQWIRVLATLRALNEAPLWIDDSPGSSVVEICARAHQARAERGLELLVVDYLQLIRGDDRRRYENRNLEIDGITRRLKALAKELEIPIILLSQLSRQAAHRGGDHRPQLSDLRESGAIEQHADVVQFVHRPEVYEPVEEGLRGLVEVIVAKVRNGKPGTVEMGFRGDLSKFLLARPAPRGPDPF